MAAPWLERSRLSPPPRQSGSQPAPSPEACSGLCSPCPHRPTKDIVDAAFPQSQGNRPEDEFARLLERARSGDPEAVGVLLSDLHKYLLKLAEQDWPDELRRRESPSELVQQALVRVAAALPAFHGEPLQWRAWAAKILKNRMIQRRRFHEALRRNPSLEVPLSPLFAGSSANLPVATSESGPLSRMGREELHLILRQLVSELPAEDREILRLRIEEDLAWAQIASEVQSTAEAVRKRFGRAVRAFTVRLRELLPTLSEAASTDNSGPPRQPGS
jgi:RNA polymerase sigma factor (sigma-70 family)